ncbi:MAG: cytochrome c [Lacibacter sp.]|nr:cytochrome c [Lacibacter sp.]
MKPFLIIALSLLLLVSCTYNKEELLYNNACDTSNVKYSVQVLNILTTNCIGCHSASGAAGGVMLDDFTNVRAVAISGRLLGAITHTSGYRAMPDFAPKLPECRIAEIRTWIRNGMLNN